MSEKARRKLGDDLFKAREQRKLTQAEVAMKAHINVNYYARVERGEENPSLEIIQAIMKVLGIKSLPFYGD